MRESWIILPRHRIKRSEITQGPVFLLEERVFFVVVEEEASRAFRDVWLRGA